MHRTDYLPNIIGMLSTIYVDQKFRRQGIGRKLVYEICKFFKANKVEKIYLRYVLGNIEGEKFWKDLGFKKILVTAGTDINKVEKNLQRKVKI